MGLPWQKDFAEYHHWIKEITAKLVSHGLDSQFYIFDEEKGVEYNLLSNLGMCEYKDWISRWEDSLLEGLNNRLPCYYDQLCMKQSGTFILNSLSPAFRKTLVREHDCTPNGPSIFAAVINKLQKMTSNAIRDIEGQLSKLDLSLEKGENVLTFCNKIQDLADTLDQGVIYKPPDLNKMVAQRFINSQVLTFQIQATLSLIHI